MAKQSEMCPYFEKTGKSDLRWRSGGHGDALKEMPPAQRVQCPACGRRMKAWLSVGYDACCVHQLIPPHKRKDWWKKPKKRVEKRMAPRGK